MRRSADRVVTNSREAEIGSREAEPIVTAEQIITARGLRRGRCRRCRRGCSPRGARRISAPAWSQIASSTHWPSWSHAPSWCGSPKSPSVIGPSTADTISDSRISSGGRGEHVAAADAALRPHQSRRPSARAGSARGTAGGGRCARRCRAPRSARRRRAARATATLGRHSRRGSTLARRTIVRRLDARRIERCACDPAVTWWTEPSAWTDARRRRRRSFRTTRGRTSAASFPRCSARRPGDGPARLDARPVRAGRAGRAARARRPRVGSAPGRTVT